MFKHSKNIKNRLFNVLIDYLNIVILLTIAIVTILICQHFHIDTNLISISYHFFKPFLGS